MELNVKQEPPTDVYYEFTETTGETRFSCNVQGEHSHSATHKPVDGDYTVHQLQKERTCSDVDMLLLLQEWGLEMLFERFAENLIDVSVLDYIVDVDIVDLCKGFPMRYRIILRHKLQEKSYKREHFNQSQSPVRQQSQHQLVETPVVSQDVAIPMESCSELVRLIDTPVDIPVTSSPAVVTTPASSSEKRYFTETTLPEFDLDGILTTGNGKQVIQCYKTLGRLDTYHRKQLLSMIVGKIRTDIPLNQFNARWYHAILKYVVKRFPSEEKYRNVYISRLTALKYNMNKKGKTCQKKRDSTPAVVINEQEPAYSGNKLGMPKRPLSSYMLWLYSAREQIKKDFPGLKVPEICRKGGELWRAMKEKDKLEWENKAAEQSIEYNIAAEEFERRMGYTVSNKQSH